jgi:predicted nucleic acid-binding protein
MSAKRFIDTNVLIYAFSDDDAKVSVAEGVLAAGGIISVQVLNEFTNVCRRKLKLEWYAIEERLAVVKALTYEVLPITLDHHEKAITLARAHDFGFYDALIIAAALVSNCTALISEDLQHGRTIEGLRIENPFAAC